MNFNITLLPGDGIGPEVVGEAVRVLDVIASKYNHTFNFQERLMGGCSIDKYGQPITDETLADCKASDAVLLGAVGGLILAVLAWLWLRHRPMVALMTLVLSGALLAVTAWWLGGLLGPSDPTLGAIAVGETVSEPLGLRAMGVLVAPAVVAVATFVVLAAALPPAEADERLA